MPIEAKNSSFDLARFEFEISTGCAGVFAILPSMLSVKYAQRA